MNGVLQWQDALAWFGNDLDEHARRLETAGQTTYGLLACRFLHGDSALEASRDRLHAERHLLLTDLWTEQLPRALDTWDQRSGPMLVLLALNRTPCADCASRLARALNRLNDRFPLGAERQHFVLAARGYYQGRGFMESDRARVKEGQPSRDVTTHRSLQAMREAGWRLAALDFGNGLSRRGQEWLEYLQHPH